MIRTSTSTSVFMTIPLLPDSRFISSRCARRTNHIPATVFIFLCFSSPSRHIGILSIFAIHNWIHIPSIFILYGIDWNGTLWIRYAIYQFANRFYFKFRFEYTFNEMFVWSSFPWCSIVNYFVDKWERSWREKKWDKEFLITGTGFPRYRWIDFFILWFFTHRKKHPVPKLPFGSVHQVRKNDNYWATPEPNARIAFIEK